MAELVVGACAVACSFTLEEALPEELQEWVCSQAAEPSPWLLVIYVSILCCYLTGMVGLFMQKRWARWVYLLGTLFGLLPLFGPLVEHAVTATLLEIATLLSGMVLALCFFTDALPNSPETGPDQSPVSTALSRGSP